VPKCKITAKHGENAILHSFFHPTEWQIKNRKIVSKTHQIAHRISKIPGGDTLGTPSAGGSAPYPQEKAREWGGVGEGRVGKGGKGQGGWREGVEWDGEGMGRDEEREREGEGKEKERGRREGRRKGKGDASASPFSKSWIRHCSSATGILTRRHITG
jgi:hypothetical protein